MSLRNLIAAIVLLLALWCFFQAAVAESVTALFVGLVLAVIAAWLHGDIRT